MEKDRSRWGSAPGGTPRLFVVRRSAPSPRLRVGRRERVVGRQAVRLELVESVGNGLHRINIYSCVTECHPGC
jgi:hypothetical protein